MCRFFLCIRVRTIYVHALELSAKLCMRQIKLVTRLFHIMLKSSSIMIFSNAIKPSLLGNYGLVNTFLSSGAFSLSSRHTTLLVPERESDSPPL